MPPGTLLGTVSGSLPWAKVQRGVPKHPSMGASATPFSSLQDLMFCWGGFLFCGNEAFYPFLSLSGLCLARAEFYSVLPRRDFVSCSDRTFCLAKAESCGMPRQNLASCQDHTLHGTFKLVPGTFLGDVLVTIWP